MKSENAWRTVDLAPTYPSVLLQDSAGNLLSAGIYEYPDGTLGGLWRYGTNGALTSATQLAAGGAEGAVFNGSNLWLAVDGSSSPYLDTGENAAAGTNSDILPPRTYLSMGAPSYGAKPAYITAATPLGFTVVDDAFAYGDGLGVGVAQTLYAIDQATTSLTTSSFTTYSASFTLVAEGTHTISAYSIDLEGNAANVRTSSVAVDLTAPGHRDF